MQGSLSTEDSDIIEIEIVRTFILPSTKFLNFTTHRTHEIER